MSTFKALILGLLGLLGCRENSITDSGKESACVTTRWYSDSDGDGHGDPAVALDACERPAEYVADADDCDDLDAATFPGAVDDCDGVDRDCDGSVDEDDSPGAVDWHADADADGYGAAAILAHACASPDGAVGSADDCDDAAADVHPGAAEVCDGRDDDCDGAADDADADLVGAPSWYPDDDGDGFGRASAPPVSACEAPAGCISDHQDCDDDDAAVYPGAEEVCGGADDDCDGAVDEEVASAPAWYLDADRDGYGDPGVSATGCTLPAGYTADATDCDDTDADVNPSERETCETAWDDNCDGITDAVSARACVTFYADRDLDGYGGDDAMCRCEPTDVYLYTTPDDCDDADPAIHPDAVDVAGDGLDSDCDGLDIAASDGGAALASVTLTRLESSDVVGTSLAVGPDVTGDGIADVVVGEVSTSTTLPSAWRILPADFADGGGADDAALDVYGDNWGSVDHPTPSRIADLDGDGAVDLLVSQTGWGAMKGGVLLYPGPLPAHPTLSDVSLSMLAMSGTDFGGAYAAPADLDGDGVVDLAVGGSSISAVYAFSGDTLGAIDNLSVTTSITMTGYAGRGAEAGADWTGDGVEDLVMTAHRAHSGRSELGAAYLYAGPIDFPATDADASATVWGARLDEEFGYSLVDIGDVDGDGTVDLVVAEGEADAGAWYVLTDWGASGTVDTLAWASFTAPAGVSLPGPGVGGDFDGDGTRDVVFPVLHADTGAYALWAVLDLEPGAADLSAVDVDLGTLSSSALPSIAAWDLEGDGATELYYVERGGDAVATVTRVPGAGGSWAP